MKHPLQTFARHLLNLMVTGGLLISLPSLAATAPVALATSPLATSTTSVVQPNLMLMLDDSGSMDWDYMPDVVKGFKSKYGLNSNQCNGVYYNPAITYTPPVYSDGTSYPNSSFTNAINDGYDSASGTTNLSTSFTGGSGTGASASSGGSTQAAFYYKYSGTQTTAKLQDFFNTSSTFYLECNSSIGSTPGSSVFTKVIVSATSGPGATDERTNFANWFSYYSTRMLMMKTGVGQAFKVMPERFRIGFMTMNNNKLQDFVDPDTFAGGCTVGSGTCQKDMWYSKLYGSNPGQSTPLRVALSEIGQLYANKFGPVTTYTATITVSGSSSINATVSSIKVGTTELMPATSAGSTNTSTVAKNIAAEINASLTGTYGATVSSSVITIKGPSSALGTLPVIIDNNSGMKFTATSFVANTVSAKLNNVIPKDPMQFSCQKNFVILSTDGYWNGGAGYKLDNSAIGKQDGLAPRPMYDGGTATKTTSQVRESITQVTQTVSQTQRRTLQEQKQISQLKQDAGTLQVQTSTLQTRTTTGTAGTKSKVLMRCNNTSGTCGTAPSNGVANINWSVVTSGSCTLASNVQCQIVPLSGNATVVTTCNTAANISTATGNPSVTVTITNSNNAVIDRVRANGSSGTRILSATTSASSTNNTVASRIAANINTCTSSATGSCDVSGHSATVSGNVITITGPNVTASLSVRVSSGSATITVSNYSAGGTTYTLNNADSNGLIYSACTTNWSSWTDAAAACVPSATRECRYVTAPGSATLGWSTATNATGACTPVTADNSNLTATQCSYTWVNGQNTSACSTPTFVANDFSNTLVYRNCATATSAWANAVCTASNTTPDASGMSYQCRTLYNDQLTDTPPGGYVGVPSCSAQTKDSNGLTVLCPTTNPVVTSTYVLTSCTDSSTSCAAPYTSNSCAATHCSTATLQSPTLVTSCTASNSGSPDYKQTTCTNSTPVVTTGVSGCVPEAPSALNNFTTTTCTGGTGGTSDTLADTAMYYYETDLRTSALNNCAGGRSTAYPSGNPDVCPNNVPSSGIDTNSAQHLTTFTLGLGARGKMVYSSDYLNDSSGDFYDVKKGTTATTGICSWQTSGACNWPMPPSGGSDPTTIDDLWHAAIDGRGTYFSATDPLSLSVGLREALKSIDQKTGAAAAAATSTLNPTAADHFAYVASYTTSKWIGNLEQRQFIIDANGKVTSEVSKTADWAVEDIAPDTLCAALHTKVPDTSGGSTRWYCSMPATDANGDGVVNSADCTAPDLFDAATTACREQIVNAKDGMLSLQVGPSAVTTDSCYNLKNCDTRTIYTANDAGTALIAFDSAYGTAHASALDASKLSQWASLTTTQQTTAQANLVNYLRGRKNYEENRTLNATSDWLFRYRDATFGDALESQPTYLGVPTFTYSDPGYSAFLTANANRAGTVFIGANDGMVHAFNAATGAERWAYIPTMVIPNLWKLADKNYTHSNYVNGSPVVSDICVSSCGTSSAVWKSILVGGLNAGGRGYYALDVTNPTTPVLLWEFKPSNTANLGYSYGKPVIAKKADGTWVVVLSSGYDNGNDSSTPVTPATTPATFVANTPQGDGKGHLYVLNAGTGAIISDIVTTAGTASNPSGFARFSIYNDIPGNDLSAGNLAGFAYGGDLEGNVWRFDINDPTTIPLPGTGTGKVEQFALLKDSSGNTQPVTVAPTLGLIKNQRVIFVGTGRYLETADLASTQLQSLYAIKDNTATATAVTNFINPRSTLVPVTLTTLASGVDRTGSPATGVTVNFTTGRGWYVDFPESKERVNIESKLVGGLLIAPTIVPSNTICSPGGTGWLNYFDYETGVGGSIKYETTIVGVNIIYIDGKPVPLVVTNDDPTPIATRKTLPFRQQQSSGFTRTREGWRELIP